MCDLQFKTNQSCLIYADAVHPICLPVSDELKNRNFVRNLPFIAGWGATSWSNSNFFNNSTLNNYNLYYVDIC